MDQLRKAGGPATSVGIDQNRARVRLFLMTPNVSCRTAAKATAVARSMALSEENRKQAVLAAGQNSLFAWLLPSTLP
jgi:hypothetical protein